MFSPRELTNRSHHSYVLRLNETSPGAIWIARTHGDYHQPTDARCIDCGSIPQVGVKAAIAAGFTPVPIPNTEVKPASVPVSTGVRESLGNSVRRLHSYSRWTFPPHSSASNSHNAVRGFLHVSRGVATRSARADCIDPLTAGCGFELSTERRVGDRTCGRDGHGHSDDGCSECRLDATDAGDVDRVETVDRCQPSARRTHQVIWAVAGDANSDDRVPRAGGCCVHGC